MRVSVSHRTQSLKTTPAQPTTPLWSLCRYVKASCANLVSLVDYLALIYCPGLVPKPAVVFGLTGALVLIVSLLATTVSAPLPLQSSTSGCAHECGVTLVCFLFGLLAARTPPRDLQADYFFVPALEYLSFEMLMLKPEVAGITFLALGNGSPDVFGALAG